MLDNSDKSPSWIFLDQDSLEFHTCVGCLQSQYVCPSRTGPETVAEEGRNAQTKVSTDSQAQSQTVDHAAKRNSDPHATQSSSQLEEQTGESSTGKRRRSASREATRLLEPKFRRTHIPRSAKDILEQHFRSDAYPATMRLLICRKMRKFRSTP